MNDRLAQKDRLVLLAIILAGFVLRLAFANRSFYEDEFFSVYWIKQGLAYIWGPGLAIESNPPLYYTILFFWAKLFGISEIALRLPTILASTATIAIVYQIGVQLFNRNTALIAAALFAINSVAISWADQARSYGFQIYFSALCLLAIVRYFQNADNKLQRIHALELYVVAASLLGWMHYSQVFFLAACGIGVSITCLWHKQMPLVKGWCLANLCVFLLTAFEIPLMLSIGTHPGLVRIWMPPAQIPGNIAIMLSGTSYPILATFVAGAIIYAGIKLWAENEPRSFLIQLVVIEIPVLYIALLFGANFFHSVFVARVLVMLAIPSALIIAKILGTENDRFFRVVAIGAIVLIYVISLRRDMHATPFREMFAAFAERYRPGDMIVFGPYGRIGALDYYQPGIFSHGVERWRPDPSWDVVAEDKFWNDTLHVNATNTSAISQAIAQHRRVWLILMEDDEMMTLYRRSLSPAPIVFADDKLLHIYLWQGGG